MLERYDYIVRDGLFGGTLKAQVERFLMCNARPKTIAHVLAVADKAGEIAGAYDLDRDACVRAGLLHDISAVVRPADMLKYMQKSGAWLDDAELKFPSLLHQRISAQIAREDFGVGDERVLSAAGCHTTLKRKCSRIDMAVFLADKLAWDQEGTPPHKRVVEDGLAVSLERASLAYIDYVMDAGTILYPHSWLLEAREALGRYLA